MKRIILVLYGIIISFCSFSQESSLVVDRNVSEYSVDTLYSQIDYCYSNNSDSTYILWIEKENVNSLSNMEKIRKHFFTQNGDFSLMQLIWDGNVSSFIPGLFDSFFKILKPGDQFTVSYILIGLIQKRSAAINFAETHIVIVNARDINGLNLDKAIDKFNYKARNVTIFDKWLKIQN